MVDRGCRHLVLGWGGVGEVVGGPGTGVGAMERVMRINGSGAVDGCLPTLGSGCVRGSAGGGVVGAREPV